MSSAALKHAIPYSQFEQLREARDVIRHEAQALEALAARLDTRFCEAVELIETCQGRVVTTGIGKAGHIARKIAATFSSTGTPSVFLHPAEAVHGDLGCITENDVVLAFSNSGETEEVCRLIPIIRRLGACLIAVTARAENTLARGSQAVLEIGSLQEAGQLRLAPSTTTTAMLAMGDALALVVSRLKSFTAEQFSVFHPGGSLGKQLTRVDEVMRRGSDLRVAHACGTIREILQKLCSIGRRSGAILLTDDDGALCGVFTDSDLARLLEKHRDNQLDRPISEVMTREPTTITADAFLSDAVELLSDRKFSELPVVDSGNRPIGLLDITDVIGLQPGRT